MNRPGSGVCSSRCISGWDVPIRSDDKFAADAWPGNGNCAEYREYQQGFGVRIFYSFGNQIVDHNAGKGDAQG